jgi:hypothetical protein
MGKMIGYVLGFISGVIIGIGFGSESKHRFKVGDIIYLKPTGQKCIISLQCGSEKWFLDDMKGIGMNGGFAYHQGLFDKTPPTMQ